MIVLKVSTTTQTQIVSSNVKAQEKKLDARSLDIKNNGVSLPKKTPTVEQEKLNSGMNKIETVASIVTGVYAVLPAIDSVAYTFSGCLEQTSSDLGGDYSFSCGVLSMDKNQSEVLNGLSYLVPFALTYGILKVLQKVGAVDQNQNALRYSTLAGIGGLTINHFYTAPS